MSKENRSIRVEVGSPGVEQPHSTAPRAEAPEESGIVFTPPIDIHEGPDGLVLEADLPGAGENDVTIQLEHNVLNLHAKAPAAVAEGARTLYEEYQIGAYFRSFILSDEVERSRITAELKNGVLRLTLPKAERAKTRRIEIKS